jgi:hypothetical protein
MYYPSQNSLLRQQWLVLVILVRYPLRYSEPSHPNPLATLLAVCYASEDEGFAPDGEVRGRMVTL